MRRALAMLVLCLLGVGAAPDAAAASPQPAQQGSAPQVRGYAISGTVVDAVSGAPLSGARVFVSPVWGGFEAREFVVGEDGRFFFPMLPAGKFALTGEARGYRRQAFNEHEGFSSAIVTGPDISSENLVLRLTRGAAISGRVLDEQGDPVANASVDLRSKDTLTGLDTWHSVQSTQTSDDGSYRFSHLSPGNYVIRVSAAPWYAQHSFSPRDPSNANADGVARAASPLDVVYPVTYFGDATEQDSATPIVLKPGQRAVADITLRPVPAIRVRLTTPLSEYGVGVRIYEADASGGSSARADAIAPGVVEIVGLRPGHYDFTISGNEPKVPAKFATAVDIGADGQAQVKAPSAAVPLTGVIRTDVPDAATQATVQLSSEHATHVLTAKLPGKTDRTDNGDKSAGNDGSDRAGKSHDGELVFEDQVPPGTYNVLVGGLADAYTRKIVATGARVTGRRIQIAGPGPVRLEVFVGHGAAGVQGIALKDGIPFAGAMIILVPENPAGNVEVFRRDQSDGDGTFTLQNALPGKYTLIAVANAWDLEWANPDVLKRYLPQGVPIEVQPNGKYAIQVNVQ